MSFGDIDRKNLPAHIGLVMDGNGRWANERGLTRMEGHRAGEEALHDAVEGALDAGLKWLTAYAFSTENWRRTPEEVRFLLRFPQEVLLRRIDKLDKLDVRVRVAGRRDRRMPKDVVADIESAIERTKKNKSLNLVLAFNYGGRAEIVDAVNDMVVNGKKITEKAISKHLYVPEAPEPDLIIRTSGEFRTSNFLIWQGAYAEWEIVDKMWPEFRREDLWNAIVNYQRRDRRFGGVNE